MDDDESDEDEEGTEPTLGVCIATLQYFFIIIISIDVGLCASFTITADRVLGF